VIHNGSRRSYSNCHPHMVKNKLDIVGKLLNILINRLQYK
jgi:hypothetical protein